MRGWIPWPPLVLNNLFTEADILQIVIFALFEKLAPQSATWLNLDGKSRCIAKSRDSMQRCWLRELIDSFSSAQIDQGQSKSLGI